MTTGQKIRLESRMQGRAEGRTEGRAEGEVKRHAEIILRQMTKRFGPLTTETIQRVQSAAPSELDLWTDRILDSKTLAEVLAVD